MKRNIFKALLLTALIGAQLKATVELHYGDWVALRSCWNNHLSDRKDKNGYSNVAMQDLRQFDLSQLGNEQKWKLVNPDNPADTSSIRSPCTVAFKTARQTYLSISKDKYGLSHVSTALTDLNNACKWTIQSLMNSSTDLSSISIRNNNSEYLVAPQTTVAPVTTATAIAGAGSWRINKATAPELVTTKLVKGQWVETRVVIN